MHLQGIDSRNFGSIGTHERIISHQTGSVNNCCKSTRIKILPSIHSEKYHGNSNFMMHLFIPNDSDKIYKVIDKSSRNIEYFTTADDEPSLGHTSFVIRLKMDRELLQNLLNQISLIYMPICNISISRNRNPWLRDLQIRKGKYIWSSIQMRTIRMNENNKTNERERYLICYPQLCLVSLNQVPIVENHIILKEKKSFCTFKFAKNLWQESNWYEDNVSGHKTRSTLCNMTEEENIK